LDTAVDFDGVNDFVEVLDAAKLRVSGSFAVEMWIKPHGANVFHKYFVNKGNWLAVIFGYGPNSFYDSLNFLAAAHGGFCEPGYPTAIAEIAMAGEQENWHHIVYTYNQINNAWQGYKNGNLYFSQTCQFSLDSSHADPLRIGTSDPNAGENNHVNATIDEVAIYDEYMPAAQVLSHYQKALAANSELRFEQALTLLGGGGALDGAQTVAVSPDGAHVYVASDTDDALNLYNRNATTGVLTFASARVDNIDGIDGLNGVFGVAISADGKSLYATGEAEDELARFDRNPTTGVLSQGVSYVIHDGVGMGSGGQTDGLNAAKGIALSPDGKSIYVAGQGDDSIALFARDPSTGAITDYVQVIKDISNINFALNGAWAVAVSPDNAHVYVTSDIEDAVNVFSRDLTTGSLTWLETRRDNQGGVNGLMNARSITISPDGKHVYVTGRSDDAVAIFSRATSGPNFGKLTFVTAVGGMNGATSIACDPAGARCYVAAELGDALYAFSRNPTTGVLTLLDVDQDAIADTSDCAAVTNGLNGVRGVAVSPDSANVYAAGFTDDAVSGYSVW
jgi:DNA-binding beta-propeller fold protein YncE